MPWRPILPDEKLAAADEALRAIVNDLGGRPLGSSQDNYLHRPPVDSALLYAYLSVARHSAKSLDQAVECLNHSVDETARATPGGAHLGLYGGLSGLGWCLEHIPSLVAHVPSTEEDDAESLRQASAEDEPEDLNEFVDVALLSSIRQELWRGQYDLINGLVGFGVYFLERIPRSTAVEGLGLILGHLSAAATVEDEGVSWYTDPELLSPQQLEVCPNGYYNLGVAHGIPGVLWLLSEMAAVGVGVEKATQLLDRGVSWLLKHKQPAGFLSRYASWYVPDSEPYESRLGWCYGDLGIAAVLLQLARRAARPDWLLEARSLLEHCLAWPVEKSSALDAPLCHGAAGIAHIFNRVYQLEGDERYRSAAIEWFDRAFAMRRPNSGVGGYCAFVPPNWQPRADFLDGAIGVALSLLAATTPIEPMWDRLMLLSSRNS